MCVYTRTEKPAWYQCERVSARNWKRCNGAQAAVSGVSVWLATASRVRFFFSCRILHTPTDCIPRPNKWQMRANACIIAHCIDRVKRDSSSEKRINRGAEEKNEGEFLFPKKSDLNPPGGWGGWDCSREFFLSDLHEASFSFDEGERENRSRPAFSVGRRRRSLKNVIERLFCLRRFVDCAVGGYANLTEFIERRRRDYYTPQTWNRVCEIYYWNFNWLPCAAAAAAAALRTILHFHFSGLFFFSFDNQWVQLFFWTLILSRSKSFSTQNRAPQLEIIRASVHYCNGRILVLKYFFH